MKTRIFIFLGLFYSVFAIAQNNECEVILEEIKGTYAGDCKKGKAHGEGKSEGIDVYEGEFKKGWPDGEGLYTWRAGKQFKGEFKRGKKDGYGEMTDIINGVEKVTKGYWVQDEYIGEENLPPYRVVDKQSLEGIKFTRLNSNGISIRLRPVRDGNLNQTAGNMFITADSGNLREANGEYILDDVNYPVEVMVKFTSPNRMNTTQLNIRTTFQINHKGDWLVKLDH